MSRRSVRFDCEHTFVVAHPAYLKEKVRQLRREKKLTIDELVERLALPRTTIYYWVRDLEIDRKPATSFLASAQRKGNGAMTRKYRLRREAAYRQGREEFMRLARIPLFRDFVCLYIAEGYKRRRGTVSIVNSDPTVVSLAAYWLNSYSVNRVRYRLQYHADQDPAELRQFWATELGIDSGEIAAYPKSNSGELKGRKWRCEYGLLTVDAHDTLFRSRLQAWMDCLQDQWLDSVEIGA